MDAIRAGAPGWIAAALTGGAIGWASDALGGWGILAIVAIAAVGVGAWALIGLFGALLAR